MKHDTFKLSLIIILIGSTITKLGSFIIKILFTRTIGEEGLSYYTIIIPTATLFISLSTMQIPLTISKIISEKTYNSKSIIITTSILLIITNIILSTIYIVCIPFISNNLLHNQHLSLLLYAFVLTIPFVCSSSILKGYFLGKLKVYPNIISNIIEQLIRIIFLLLILPSLKSTNLYLGLISYILLNIITEIVSIIIFSLFLPPHQRITKKDITFNPKIAKEVLNMSIPITSSHLIGIISFFFEPIIITNILLSKGFSLTYITTEYASYNAYTIALLTIPSFFISAMNQVFIPEISKYNKFQNTPKLKKRIKESLLYSILIGLIYLIFLSNFKEHLLYLLYHTNKGLSYLTIIIPYFILFYLEYPLHSILEALGYPKKVFTITLYGIIIKLLTLIVLAIKKLGIYALVYAEIINIIVVVLLLLHHLLLVYHKLS